MIGYHRKFNFIFDGMDETFYVFPTISIKPRFKYKIKTIKIETRFMFIRLAIYYTWSTIDFKKMKTERTE